MEEDILDYTKMEVKIVQGDAAGSRIQAVTQLAGDDSGEALSATVSFLDSPNTTSQQLHIKYI